MCVVKGACVKFRWDVHFRYGVFFVSLGILLGMSMAVKLEPLNNRCCPPALSDSP